MNYHRLKILFQKHLSNTLERDEVEEFFQLLEHADESTFKALFEEHNEGDLYQYFDKEEVYELINTQIEDLEKGELPNIERLKPTYSINFLLKIAASIILLFAISYVVYRYTKLDHTPELASKLHDSISRDSLRLNSANIQFADGKLLDLADLSYDTVVYKGIVIIPISATELSISNHILSGDFDKNQFHTFSAKTGSTLTLNLPDKSIVQLNSGSSLKISAGFGVQDRHVHLNGEGFFEVAHHQDVPFTVQVKQANINVLGTVFNISGYDQDAQIKTTLVSGLVKVNTPNTTTVIQPGQQAKVDSYSSRIAVVKNVDMAQELAWREGVFRFKNETVREILQELSKWYFIKDVEIAPGLTDRFTGSINRSKQLRDVLDAVEKVSDLHFEIQEGRVIVMK